MANNIELFKTYIPLIDEVYKNGATTAAFDSNQNMVKMAANGKDFMVPKYSTDGLGKYDRNGKGYPQGSVTLEFETKSPNFDRANKFGIEDQDNTETVGLAFGALAGTFMRTNVIPEVDAFRYAKYSDFAGIKDTSELKTGEDWLAAIRAQMVAMDDAEVPQENRHLRITAAGLDLIQHLDVTKRTVVMDKFASIVTVPSARFYSAITQYDGFTDGKFGYAKAEGALALNFVIVQPMSLIQADKSVITKVFTPQENQVDDKWMFFYHNYGICEKLDNKVKGIGANLAKATA